MNTFSFLILNILINSLLAFFTASFFIEVFLFIFRVKQGRFAANLRMLPILKLPLDLFLYDFSKWSYVKGVNPVYCEEGTRTLNLMFEWMTSLDNLLPFPITAQIQLTLPENMTFTLADLVGYQLKPTFLSVLASTTVILSIIIT